MGSPTELKEMMPGSPRDIVGPTKVEMGVTQFDSVQAAHLVHCQDSEDLLLIQGRPKPYYWMGNMSPWSVKYEDEVYGSTEALFQCLRVQDKAVRRRIREAKNGYVAKLVAKANADKRTVVPLSPEDLDLMRICLWAKIDQHPRLRKALMATETRTIIEDCTARQQGTGLFWGAGLRGGTWYGLNWLGVLWMEVRSMLLEREAEIDAFLNP